MKYIHLPSIDSTNTYAKKLLQQGEQNSFVVYADEQTAGRGQQGKTWQSPQGSLYLTLALKWENHFETSLTRAPLVFGELISGWCQQNFGFCPQVKWPNDLYFAGQKLSGILCEKFQGFILVGVGININHAPLEHSVSVSQIVGQSFAVTALQKSLFEYVEMHGKSALENSFKSSWALYQKAWVSSTNQTFTAKSIGTDGALELSSAGSEPIKLFSADHQYKTFFQSEDEHHYVLLDVGNSRTKAALFSSQKLPVVEYGVGDATEMASLIKDWQTRFGVTLVVTVSVNHEALTKLKQQLPEALHWLALSKYLPYLKSKYALSQIGLDRLAAMEAAGYYLGRKNPMVVVSAGTAMTVDLITHDFNHIGGYICAGLTLKLRALSGCSLLPEVKVPEELTEYPPTQTSGALAYGAVHESVAFIRNMMHTLGGETKLVLTGGDASILKPYFPDALQKDKLIVAGGNLMLRGGYIS